MSIYCELSRFHQEYSVKNPKTVAHKSWIDKTRKNVLSDRKRLKLNVA